MTKCPHCGKVAYPVKNENGTINWKNVFRIDWLTVILVISILLILFGVKQINKQCYDILEEPCDFLNQYNCTGNTYTQHLMNYQAGVNNEEKEHADFINQFNTT